MVNNWNNVYSITDFGAVSGGEVLCTKAFQKAIEACKQNGGGSVVVPAGHYLTGPIKFYSHIHLYIEAGARVAFVQDAKEYPVVDARWEGKECEAYASLLYGDDLENVTISGQGVLDGQGSYWWQLKRDKELAYPRPKFVSFMHSKNIRIEGVSFENSPSWTINPIDCENVTIEKITINNPGGSPNTDGINPDSCRYVHIANCHISVGDDCITIKSGIEESDFRIPCEHITVTNCTMERGHGGVVIGSEMSGDIRNVVISNCIFNGTDRGIRFKSRRGRGGVVEDVQFSHIIMDNVICPFVFNLYYYYGQNSSVIHDDRVKDVDYYEKSETTPVFRHIHMSHIVAKNVTGAAGFIYGLQESPIEDMTFDHVQIRMTKSEKKKKPAMMHGVEPMTSKGFYCKHGKNISFHHVTIEGHEGEPFIISDTTPLIVNHEVTTSIS